MRLSNLMSVHPGLTLRGAAGVMVVPWRWGCAAQGADLVHQATVRVSVLKRAPK
jgi:hypothetical protein